MTADLNKDKQVALEMALGRIEKDHGKGAVMRSVSYTHLTLPTSDLV